MESKKNDGEIFHFRYYVDSVDARTVLYCTVLWVFTPNVCTYSLPYVSSVIRTGTDTGRAFETLERLAAGKTQVILETSFDVVPKSKYFERFEH